MFVIIDAFNNCTVSRHRSLLGVARAMRKLADGLRKRGGGCYLPTEIRHSDGSPLTDEEDDDLRNYRNNLNCGWYR